MKRHSPAESLRPHISRRMTPTKRRRILLVSTFLILAVAAWGQGTDRAVPPSTAPHQPAAFRVVELRASDGTILKANYFAAAKPGPSVLLLHQVNRTRKSWDDVAAQLAAAGINALTLDMRGYGESGGTPCAISLNASPPCQQVPGDIDTALQYLALQPGVKRDVIGVAGAGLLGVDNSVQAARRHSAEVKSLALLSGETFQPDLQFLRQASQLPGLFVMSDDDEYPPTQEAMELLYITSANPGKKFVHYSAAQEAPWLWYEPFDLGKVPANGGHGTDMFNVHQELPGIIVNWFVSTLIRTPGHAPADTVASGQILNQIELPGGVAQATQQLMETRRKDPEAQLWPEITVSIIGNDHLRAGETKVAIEIFELNLLAYPNSADAHDDLADAYLADGQKDLARQHAEKVLALLDAHTSPASSWSDTEPRRGEIRHDAEHVLKKLSAPR
jgi:dienelactone hydrolase